MVEAILIQIPPPVREALRVRAAYHRDHVMYAEHVLLHGLTLPLLDLIQGPYGIVQHVSPFARVPTETGKDVGAHASFIILLEEGIHFKVPEHVCHLGPWIGQLKHIQSCGCQPFLLPTPSVAPAPTPVACGLTHSGVPIRVQCPSVLGGGGGEPPPPTVVRWNFGGLLHNRTTPLWVVSLASVTSSTPEALLTCCGALPTSWLEESDPPAATTEILWTGFSARPLSLQQSEAATDHLHTSMRGKRLMVKWAECEIHSEKASST